MNGKNTSVSNMNENKSTTLYGTLLIPVRVGSRAVILQGGSFIHTSTVVAIHSVKADEICFETRNTIYHVLLDPVDQPVDYRPAVGVAA